MENQVFCETLCMPCRMRVKDRRAFHSPPTRRTFSHSRPDIAGRAVSSVRPPIRVEKHFNRCPKIGGACEMANTMYRKRDNARPTFNAGVWKRKCSSFCIPYFIRFVFFFWWIEYNVYFRRFFQLAFYEYRIHKCRTYEMYGDEIEVAGWIRKFD